MNKHTPGPCPCGCQQTIIPALNKAQSDRAELLAALRGVLPAAVSWLIETEDTEGHEEEHDGARRAIAAARAAIAKATGNA